MNSAICYSRLFIIPIPSGLYRHYLPYSLEGLHLLAVQQEDVPFPQVINVSDACLPLRVEPLSDAVMVACAAERVLLQDQGGDMIADDGITCRQGQDASGHRRLG